jgi:type IV pilus assembly protein PilN
VRLFDELARNMPDGTYLTAFKQNDKKLRFEGVALSSTRVSALMRNISASQYMKDPELEVVESKKEQANGDSFVLDAVQVASATDEDDAARPKGPRRPRAGGAQ